MTTALLHLNRTPLGAFSRKALPYVLGLVVFSSGFVMFEPSVYEVGFLLLLLCLATNMPRFPALLITPIILLMMMNIGGFLASSTVIGDGTARNVMTFSAISLYLAVTTIIFAAMVAENPQERFATIRKAYIAAAFIVALTGIAGYFNIAGLGEMFTLYDRAKGTFKDPNVFGPFLILPMLVLVQDFLTGTQRRPVLSLVVLGVLTIGLFLSFSRGAWALLIFCGGLMTYLLVVTAPSLKQRGRIILISGLGVLGLSIVVGGLLAAPKIREVFFMRAELVQDYDGGSHGRFANQKNSIPMMLDRPLGLGPYQFARTFEEDPHNVYLNAFSSYGWLGGVSYFVFIVITLLVGLRGSFRRVPWQNAHIATFAVFTGLAAEGMVVDTDHWRHFYLLAGILWGMSAAGQTWLAQKQ